MTPVSLGFLGFPVLEVPSLCEAGAFFVPSSTWTSVEKTGVLSEVYTSGPTQVWETSVGTHPSSRPTHSWLVGVGDHTDSGRI